MKEQLFSINSSDNKLQLSCYIKAPKENAKAVIQISHGMAEHKERYYPFMEYLANNGIACIINDHRGHGQSIESKEDLGYFYDETGEMIVEDMYAVTKKMKEEYPDIPYFIFAHSMGTLVARNYIQKYDKEIDGFILCGAPFENKAASLGIKIVDYLEKLKGKKHRSNIMNLIVFGSFNDKFEENIKNKWLNSNMKEVQKYNKDHLCGFTFTLNGFRNLFKLIENAFKKERYNVKNEDLPILFIAGEDDPVIGNEQDFHNSIEFLKEVGYKNIKHILYFGMRHEILNEKNKLEVYKDILDFIEKNIVK